jgi:hypothetical protein
MCLAVALLGLVWSAPPASAQSPVCRQVSALVRVGQTFHGATCFAITYTTVNGRVITSTSCRCQASLCRFCFPPLRPGVPGSCHSWVANAHCVPLTLVKSP